MGFAEDIAKFAAKCNGNADKVIRKTVLDIGKSLVEKTPVGDADYWKKKPPPGYVGGHARANWQHSTGAPVVSEVIGTDKDGNRTIGEISASVAASPRGAVHFITNSVPYIEPLEDGHSRQAPNGMVAITAQEFGGIVERAVQGVPK